MANQNASVDIRYRDYPLQAQIEVTPEMIEAGVDAYYDDAAGERWNSPGGTLLKKLVASIYQAMASRAPVNSRHPGTRNAQLSDPVGRTCK